MASPFPRFSSGIPTDGPPIRSAGFRPLSMSFDNIFVESRIRPHISYVLDIFEITITVEGATPTYLGDGKKRGLSQFESN